MSGFIPFTDEQKEKARRTDLAGLLRSQGETLRKSGSELEWLDGSQKVTIRGNLWFHQYEQVGGDSIAFVRKFYHKSYPEAMEFLLGRSSGVLSVLPPMQKSTPKFELPPANDNMRRVFAYLLNRRGIDKDVLYAFVRKKMIYESAQYHNVVFVGFDKDGIPRHANKRGTGSASTYKGNAVGSQPKYSFHWNGRSNQLYLFEAPIDMLSFISMNKDGWRNHSYAAACSVSDKVLFQCLADNPGISKVSICFDSDEPGQLAAQRITAKLVMQNIELEILVPVNRSWTFSVPTKQKMSNGETLYIRLIYATDTDIIRFTKIRNCSNPFDADDREYFEKRNTEKMRNSLKGRKILAKLFRQQNGLCPVCGKKITVDTGFQVYDDKENRQNPKQMLHPECYRKVRKNDVSFEPVPEGEL